MNEIHLTGQIKQVWEYNDNLYCRLSVKRTPGRPKRGAKAGGPFDYVTVVFPDGKQQYHFEPGQYLTVHGWLQSRDFDETLRDFLKRTKNANDLEVSAKLLQRISVHRSVAEVVAERWHINRRGGNDK